MATKIYYRTKDGRADYGFLIRECTDGYRVYIVEQPSYCGRPDGAHETHRLSDDNGTYICWAGTLESEGDARAVAATWADGTQAYIRTGRQF